MVKIAKFLKDFKKQVIIGPIFKLTEAIFELIVPLVMASIIDIGVKQEDFSYVLLMGSLMVLLGLFGLVCAIICQFNAAKASQGFGTVLRNRLFSHIGSLSYAELDRFGTPSLITRITNDVNQLQQAVAMLIRLVIRAPFLVIGAAVMAAIIDIKLSLIFFLAIPLLAFILWFVMSRSVPLYKKVQVQLDKISLITRENLVGVRVIRAFSKQSHETTRFHAATNQLKDNAVRVGNLSALLNPMTYVIMNLAILAIIWFGGFQVDSGALTQGEIIALVNYMSQIILALVVVANLVVIFTKAAASARRVNEILDTKPSVVEESTEPFQIPDTVTAAVSFEQVSFSYGGKGDMALSSINLKIPAGQTIGVIGGTGSGKSTLMNLIARFYDPTEGKVLLYGTDVRKIPFSDLRKLVAVVLQHAVLFSGTLRENMQWADENATDAQIASALEIAQASEFVSKLPNGYDTQILQGGRNLSGGQKQRLTIARALVSNPKILILDDSASALDFATDAALRKALNKNRNDRTLFLVSQRVNTVKSADCILVLDEGEIVGMGTHQQLFDTCEVYREICLSQLSDEEVKRQ